MRIICVYDDVSVDFTPDSLSLNYSRALLLRRFNESARALLFKLLARRMTFPLFCHLCVCNAAASSCVLLENYFFVVFLVRRVSANLSLFLSFSLLATVSFVLRENLSD